ncbi:MAG: hypothetical protein Q8L45_01840 [Xanthomonadaceae bacterium]|nr:hypothetical protein [Xanthomonadaceae bacterium]MDP2186157.1 hypothetical protein [Xanthomonadales bacterium]MDZ4117315.1 hypothetical protein [Xanthomonadaceae bacterium]MDZ4377756.1 hypothetical protein [Xanthomonadaceae bacterium]
MSAQAHVVSARQCDDLFAAVLAHDAIDLSAPVPESIHLDYTQAQLAHCYVISQQLWKDGIDRRAFAQILKKIRAQPSLTATDQLYFKHVRAKFKHLRAAYAAFDQQHRYPRMFHWLISIMGYLQDALKNKQQRDIHRLAMLLGFLWQPIPYSLISRKIDHFRPCSTESFRSYVAHEMQFIRNNLDKDGVTSKEFHDTRKVISRQVAIYDNLKVLYPSPYHHCVSAYFNTINGMMGSLHDDLIVKDMNKTQNYHADRFPIPDAIRTRLLAVTGCYR